MTQALTPSSPAAPGGAPRLDIVILGLSITSPCNGHATTYRGLVRELTRRGHRVLFLERDVPWYAQNRDLPEPPYGRTALYRDLEDLRRFAPAVRSADLVIVGSYVPDGIAVGNWALANARGLVAFYDIDTPVTLAKLERGDCEYLTADLVRRYGLYLSFTGGPTLQRIERVFGSPRARALYCSVDPELYHPAALPAEWELGYLGTWSADRQPTLQRLLIEPARRRADLRFVVAGPQYPAEIAWPANVRRIEHLSPAEHAAFYNRQRFTLNITRADMIRAGYSPSLRLFEAAACGTAIISDWWDGLDEVLAPGEQILIARDARDVLHHLGTGEKDRQRIGQAARQRILSAHTAAHRAAELEGHVVEMLCRR